MKKRFVVKNNKKLLYSIIIILIGLILFVNLTVQRGTFEKLILDQLSSTNFELIDIGRKDMNIGSREQKYIKNSSEIDELVNIFSKLKLLEVKSIPTENPPETSYYIDFITETDEYVYLKFYQPARYMRIGVDGKDFIIEKTFKIVDGDIDYSLLNKLITK